MIIGLLKEIKNHEYRVGLVPASVRALTQCGHTVYVQTHAGDAIGLTDKDYLLCGAVLLPTAQDVDCQSERTSSFRARDAAAEAHFICLFAPCT